MIHKSTTVLLGMQIEKSAREWKENRIGENLSKLHAQNKVVK